MNKSFSYLLLFLIVSLNIQILAQPPELDTTFGNSGVIFTNNSGLMEDLEVLPDGKMLTLGACRNINAPFFHVFCISRINVDGSTDGTFGGQIQFGSVLTRIPEADQNTVNPSKGLAIQSDNKIIAVGYASINGQVRYLIVRYHPNGDLDQDFGEGGILTSQMRGTVNELVVLPNDKFLIVGTDLSSRNDNFVARYNSDGTLDTTFGNNGVSTLILKGHSSTGLSIALQPDGKIVTGGFITTLAEPIESNYLLTRLNQDGSLDTTFDEDGYKKVEYVRPSLVRTSEGFLDIEVQVDGRILALGNANIIYRFNSDGSLDTSFGTNGSRVAIEGVGSNDSLDLIVTPSRKITVVGHRTIPISSRFPPFSINFRVAKYLSDGTPDSTFGQNGYLEFNAADSGSASSAVTVDLNGRIIVGGHSASQILFGNWQNPLFRVARFIAPPVQNVSFSGRVLSSKGRPIRNVFIQLEDESGTIHYSRTNPFGYFKIQNVQSGQTYTLSANAKRYNFNSRSVLVDDEITNYLIVSN